MLHGCIPVFIGPPYHSQPFFPELDYAAFSVFYHVKAYSQWVDTEARGWILDLWDLDTDASKHMILVPTLTAIEESLRNISHSEIVSKQKALAAARPAFIWKARFADSRPPTAVDLILKSLCPSTITFEPISMAELYNIESDADLE